jgi:hypothetical protein
MAMMAAFPLKQQNDGSELTIISESITIARMVVEANSATQR